MPINLSTGVFPFGVALGMLIGLIRPPISCIRYVLFVVSFGSSTGEAHVCTSIEFLDALI
jgi:hypothetical protein